MENSQSLSIESFSYTWLIDKNQPHLDVPKHNLDKKFNFDIPICNKFPVSLADDIFSDGYMMPATFLTRSRTQPSSSAPATPFFPFSSPSEDRRKWKSSRSKILQNFSGFFRPLCKGLISPRKSSRVDDLERKVWEFQSLECNRRSEVQTPSRSSIGWPRTEKGRRKSSKDNSMGSSSPLTQGVTSYYDVDSDSIKEAILHCKRSVG